MEPIYLFITINLNLEEIQMKNKPRKTNNLKKASFSSAVRWRHNLEHDVISRYCGR